MLIADDLKQLLAILPKFIGEPLDTNPRKEQLIEVVLDIGRRPEARFSGDTEYLSYRTVVLKDLDYIIKRLGKFSGDNRAGIEKTLHRISSLRNRKGNVIGLTCRIGRAIFGTVSVVKDLLEQKKSILLLGRPGVGKTTAIREIARVLSDNMKKRVIIIDTSNEIAGDGDLPHPSIGRARRMQVSSHQNQHEVMIEAVENHMPEIIIIDEIGTELEAAAARTIAERGVQLVGTAHGNALENLIKNPTITDLIGGIQYVTLGDEEAKRRGSSKSILERKAPPTFDIAVEIHDPKTWIIHENIAQSVDLLLQGQTLPLQQRSIEGIYNNLIKCSLRYNQKEPDNLTDQLSKRPTPEKRGKNNYLFNRLDKNSKTKTKKLLKAGGSLKTDLKKKFVFLYIYGINNQDLKSLIKTLKLPVIITKEIQYADAVLALTSLVKGNRKLKQISQTKKIIIYTIQNNSLLQIAKALRLLTKTKRKPISQRKNLNIETLLQKEFLTPLEEARLAVEEIVIPKNIVLDLIPRPSLVRKQQHEFLRHYQRNAVSVGVEKNRRLRIYPL
jgi:stage III sporulation protein SpoIIIAA|tara:strand:+ start:7432 stop:9099 length:1668 start_codon:yes stop_codon:yes gene_type:complete